MQGNPGKMDEIDYDTIEQRLQTLLREGPNVFADSQEPAMTLPEYYDPVKFRRGQKIFENNIFTMMIAKLSGLLLLLTIPSILVILKFTKQSGTPCAAFRRYASTVLHTCIWYKYSPDQDIEFFVSLKNVRKKHCIASRRSGDAGFGRISQLDMALTQFGFMGFTLLCTKRLGINATDDDLEGLLHFWRVIAHVLGTEERFNLCNGSIIECKALCERVLEEVFVPHLAEKDKDFEEMSGVLLEGVWPINPFINKEAFKSFTTYLIISSLPNNNHTLTIDYKSLPMTSQVLLNLQIFVHKYLLRVHYWWSSLFRAYFNHQMSHMPSIKCTCSKERRQDITDGIQKICCCDWEIKIGNGTAISLAAFEVKRLLVIVLELLIQWNVVRILGGTLPVILTFIDIFLGFFTALGAIHTLRGFRSGIQYSSTKRLLKGLLILIFICVVMNISTLGAICYNVSVKERTIANVFNISMQHYTINEWDKFDVDRIQLDLQCCGHSNYSDWFCLDWQISKQSPEHGRIHAWSIPFSCCSIRNLRTCVHTQIRDEDIRTFNNEGCSSILHDIIFKIIIVAYTMGLMLITTQIFVAVCIVRILTKSFVDYSRCANGISQHLLPLSGNKETESYSRFSRGRHVGKKLKRIRVCIRPRHCRNKSEYENLRSESSLNSLSDAQTAWIKPSVHSEHRVPRTRSSVTSISY